MPELTPYFCYLSEETTLGQGILSGRPIDADALSVISAFNSNITVLNAHTAASSKLAGAGHAELLHKKTRTTRLLQAVAYGMESVEANGHAPIKASDAGNLFKSHLYAKDLLQKSPEYLLERGNITDWGDRTFKGITKENPEGKGITAFQYAYWAQDFKMMEMMLACIPMTSEGDHIWADIYEQVKEVEEHGLTYQHQYDWPNLDAAGFPDGTTSRVNNTCTEKHFDFKLYYAEHNNYKDKRYSTSNFNWQQKNAYWVNIIGKTQRLLPVHILQRFCDPDLPSNLSKEFKGEFKRSTNFYDPKTRGRHCLFSSNLSTDFALLYEHRSAEIFAEASTAGAERSFGLEVFQLLNYASTQKITKIKQQLSEPRSSGLQPKSLLF